MSAGLACVLLIFMWVDDEMNMDKFQSEQLYQVRENVDQGGGMITRITTPGPMAAELATAFPEVEMAVSTTVDWGIEGIMTVNNKDMRARGMYADTDFFRMFTFPLLQGDPGSVLKDKMGVVNDYSGN